MLFFDTETCGFHGPTVLIQWAESDDEVNLHPVWERPAAETMRLIERIAYEEVVGFNLSFDWFHLCQTYTTLALQKDKYKAPDIDEYAENEPLARDGVCIKPYKAFDIMLHARKGPYQSTMDRGDIYIKRIPTPLAFALSQELEKRIPLKDIYFARSKSKLKKKWAVYEVEDEDGEIDTEFKNVVLKFAPSSALKALATDALNEEEEILFFGDIDLEDSAFPNELGYAPFAKAIGSKVDWKGAWPEKIRRHIAHWGYNPLARKYAIKDVVYLQKLYTHFGCPTIDDDDSVLACMVGASRWRGFSVDIEGMKELKAKTIKAKEKEINGKKFVIPTDSAKVRYYLSERMNETERLVIRESTKKVLLQEIGKWKLEDGSVHPAAERATEVLDARQANYKANLLEKFITAGRFHASFQVIGTLSSRMSGGDDLNAQGIEHTYETRRLFPLAFPGYNLDGGDFDGFEVTLADACYSDPDLRKDLLSGKKIHALFGQFVFPDMTYEQILASAKTKDDKYNRCKQAVFAMFYGGEAYTLKDRLGVDIDIAEAAYQAFCRKYKRVGIERAKIFDMFCSMKQHGERGRIEWREPADKITSMFGFSRYFTLENMICKSLHDLAMKPPEAWKALKLKVTRRPGRIQMACGAVQTALFAAAFALQASNMRAAANHVIQSSGATITKSVQRKIWDLQPHGVNQWFVQPMNIHDEIMCPTHPTYQNRVKEVVDTAVNELKSKVPLIKMEWHQGIKSWGDK